MAGYDPGDPPEEDAVQCPDCDGDGGHFNTTWAPTGDGAIYVSGQARQWVDCPTCDAGYITVDAAIAMGGEFHTTDPDIPPRLMLRGIEYRLDAGTWVPCET